MSGRFRNRRALEELPEPEILPMMNVLFMLVMVLMGMSAFLPIGVISVQAPQLGGAGAATATEPHQELNLKIMILKTGFKLSDGSLLPKNFSALRAKLIEIKAKYPQEKRVILMADPDTIYDEITHVMDAARPMFDEVAFMPGEVL
ncbi:MAG: biopolymer transporter ExbD [Myxococcaceae bacterium]